MILVLVLFGGVKRQPEIGLRSQARDLVDNFKENGETVANCLGLYHSGK